VAADREVTNGVDAQSDGIDVGDWPDIPPREVPRCALRSPCSVTAVGGLPAACAAIDGDEWQVIDCAGDFEDALHRAWPGDDRELPAVLLGTRVRAEQCVQSGGVEKLDSSKVDHDPGEVGFDQRVELSLELPDCREVNLSCGDELRRFAISVDLDREAGRRALWSR